MQERGAAARTRWLRWCGRMRSVGSMDISGMRLRWRATGKKVGYEKLEEVDGGGSVIQSFCGYSPEL